MKRECYVIAEAGSCHDGSLDKALKLVKISKDCGANAVKYQWWSDSRALAIRRHDESLYSKYEPYRMPDWWLPTLKAEADALGIDFMCTCYTEQDIATIAPFVKQFKVASFDVLDKEFISAHEQYNKPVIVSCGMLNRNDNIYSIPSSKFLHCVSSYPCPLEQVNLGVIRNLDLDGFSDHTGDPMMGAWAFLAGAGIIETHFRLDDTAATNPDFPHALSPLLLKAYVKNIRLAELAWGTGEKITQPSEAENRRYMA